MALTPLTREQLKTLFNALQDRVLEWNDPIYVPQLNEHSESGGDAISAIANEIDFQYGGGVSLFTGQRGTGKSTELKRLKKKLEDMGMVCFYADMSEYILTTKEIEISDFLVSMCGALSEQVKAAYGEDPAGRGYWVRFVDFMQSDVAIDSSTLKLGGVDVKAALKRDPTFKEQVQKQLRGHVTQLIEGAHAFVRDVVFLARNRSGDPDLKVVFILDSVERIRGVGNEAMQVYESVRNLFFAHGEALRIPPLHIVYTVPPYLSVLAAGAGSIMGGATSRRLVSTHIFKDRSRQVDEVGLSLMRQVIAVRYAKWQEVFQPEAVDRLAISSGGDLREFFRLLRLCLSAVSDDSQLPLAADRVAHAESAARNEMLPIPADHLDWLKQISKTHDTCLASDTKLPTLAHFLDNRLVLNYRNGSDWYDIHPLLRAVVDAHVTSA